MIRILLLSTVAVCESLVTATAEGRRAAFTEGAPPDKSIDWAFPIVFMAGGVEQDYIPVEVEDEDTDPALQIERRIKSYKVEREPVFCGRYEFMDAYYE